MTDKTPERIWATGDGTIGSWSASEVRMKIHMPDGWETEYVRADIYNEAKMQSLADLGQAQDALEAQKKAEAERDALRIQRDDYRDRLKGISHKINQMLKPVGGETEND
jgi:hypothetical protein